MLFKDSYILRNSIFTIMALFLLYSCSEPLGIEKDVYKSNLSDYKYFKIQIGTEFIYEVKDYDENGNQISTSKTEIWKVEKIEIIDEYSAYKINIFDGNNSFVRSVFFAPNYNLLAVYSNNFQNFAYDNEYNYPNSDKFNSKWMVISKNADNWKDSINLLNDTISVFDDSKKKYDHYVRNTYLINNGKFEFTNQSNINNNSVGTLVNTVNSTIYENYIPLNPNSANSINPILLVSDSKHYFELAENIGFKKIISECKELNRNKSNLNQLNYMYKKRENNLIEYKY